MICFLTSELPSFLWAKGLDWLPRCGWQLPFYQPERDRYSAAMPREKFDPIPLSAAVSLQVIRKISVGLFQLASSQHRLQFLDCSGQETFPKIHATLV